MSLKKAALDYHEFPTPGKVSIQPTKPCETARDLSLAYSPGVAEPCLEIEKDPALAYRYTSRGNLVAVISNGTAVLGLGDIGPLAGKPVMEGKGVLFKSFADIDVFDIEVDCKDPVKLVDTIAALAPTFGGINLEDIKAPECFYVEEELKKRLDIPVFHDDQHGTAIISAAAFLNALEVTKRDIATVRLVVNGAGASAIACTKLLVALGLPKSNIIMCDSTGVIFAGRTEGMNPYKAEFAAQTKHRTLSEAMVGADVFLGLSAADAVSPEMLISMAPRPIVFAMANPDPEIAYDVAKKTRPDVIMATGRSDFPNQVNNVLGFPYIFRGALDVRATCINEAMKLAAVRALVRLAKEPVPDSVNKAYGNVSFSFGPEYIIPKPFDPRALYYVAPEVARAAQESGVAREALDIEAYTLRLKAKQNQGREILSVYYTEAKRSKHKRVALAEGANPKVMKAAIMAASEGIAEPILLGEKAKILREASRLELDIRNIEIIDCLTDKRYPQYVTQYSERQWRDGFTESDAAREVKKAHIFGTLMLAAGEVDGLVCGVDRYFPAMVRPILGLIGPREGVNTCAGLYLVYVRNKLYFFADTAINIEMDAEKIASTAIMAAEVAESMNVEPRVALLSFSNFGSVRHPIAQKTRDALKIIQERAPGLIVDGEMQADSAVVTEILRENYPHSALKEAANVLVFPDMQSGNIAYKLLQRLGGARVVGPIILGLKAPAYVLQRHATEDEIFNMITVAVAQAALQRQKKGLSVVRSIGGKAANSI